MATLDQRRTNVGVVQRSTAGCIDIMSVSVVQSDPMGLFSHFLGSHPARERLPSVSDWNGHLPEFLELFGFVSAISLMLRGPSVGSFSNSRGANARRGSMVRLAQLIKRPEKPHLFGFVSHTHPRTSMPTTGGTMALPASHLNKPACFLDYLASFGKWPRANRTSRKYLWRPLKDATTR